MTGGITGNHWSTFIFSLAHHYYLYYSKLLKLTFVVFTCGMWEVRKNVISCSSESICVSIQNRYSIYSNSWNCAISVLSTSWKQTFGKYTKQLNSKYIIWLSTVYCFMGYYKTHHTSAHYSKVERSKWPIITNR